jgi:hypothetical protein
MFDGYAECCRRRQSPHTRTTFACSQILIPRAAQMVHASMGMHIQAPDNSTHFVSYLYHISVPICPEFTPPPVHMSPYTWRAVVCALLSIALNTTVIVLVILLLTVWRTSTPVDRRTANAMLGSLLCVAHAGFIALDVCTMVQLCRQRIACANVWLYAHVVRAYGATVHQSVRTCIILRIEHLAIWCESVYTESHLP